jgi:hypothetical protein
MNLLKDIKKSYRFCTGMKDFLSRPITAQQARPIVKDRLKNRSELFLDLIDKAVFSNPRSPYLKLLECAGYSRDGLITLVQNTDLETTLKQLAHDGVYLTFDEFKCSKNVIRNGRRFNFSRDDFDNPFLSSCFRVESGATSGPGTRSMIDFDFLAQEAENRAIVLDVYGLGDAPCILWFPILPGNAGIMNIFRQAKINNAPVKWFSHVDHRTIRPTLKNRLATLYAVYAGNLFGHRIPSPEFVKLNEAHEILDSIVDAIDKRSTCCIWTYVNSAVRICAAAKERGLDLEGAYFFVSGEPLTRLKHDEIRSVGGEAVPYFAFAEGGIMAYGCASPNAVDDMHLLTDRIGLISHSRKMDYCDDPITAFLFTSILPESPKILLNVETGDEGKIETRPCGCGFEQFGYSTHISHMTSFEKFTSEGMSFPASVLIRIVEEVLPKRYGGSISEYQVLSETIECSRTRIQINVSPRIGPINENDLIYAILNELEKENKLMAELWAQAGTIMVQRIDPIPTKRGKVFSFYRMNH